METTENQTDDLAGLDPAVFFNESEPKFVRITDELNAELMEIGRFLVQNDHRLLTGQIVDQEMLDDFGKQALRFERVINLIQSNLNKKTGLTLDDIGLCAERAYRRGFQQGVTFAHDQRVNQEDAYKFRYETPYNAAYGAPERLADGSFGTTGPLFSLVERLKMENRDIFKH